MLHNPYSPRARGLIRTAIRAGRRGAVFPASAGVDRTCGGSLGRFTSVPRERGGIGRRGFYGRPSAVFPASAGVYDKIEFHYWIGTIAHSFHCLP